MQRTVSGGALVGFDSDTIRCILSTTSPSTVDFHRITRTTPERTGCRSRLRHSRTVLVILCRVLSSGDPDTPFVNTLALRRRFPRYRTSVTGKGL